MTATIVRAELDHIDRMAVLFDAYRRFYGHAPDLDGARSFISARLEHGDSAIFLALDKGAAVGFMQLYPSFSTVAMRPVWILNDLFVADSPSRIAPLLILIEI